jgi:hypothetical protein
LARLLLRLGRLFGGHLLLAGRRLGSGFLGGGRFRQRLGLVAERAQIDEQVGALLVALHAAIGHLGAGREAAWVADEIVERFVGPGVVGHRLERIGIGVVVVMGDGQADDAPQIGSDPMGAALVEGVAGLAGARRRLASPGSAAASSAAMSGPSPSVSSTAGVTSATWTIMPGCSGASA